MRDRYSGRGIERAYAAETLIPSVPLTLPPSKTINRLLKKQVARSSGRKRDESDGEGEEDEEDDGTGRKGKAGAGSGASRRPTPREIKERPAPFYRYVQSTRDGTAVRATLSLPIEAVDATAGDGSNNGPYKRKWDAMFGPESSAAPKAIVGGAE